MTAKAKKVKKAGPRRVVLDRFYIQPKKYLGWWTPGGGGATLKLGGKKIRLVAEIL